MINCSGNGHQKSTKKLEVEVGRFGWGGGISAIAIKCIFPSPVKLTWYNRKSCVGDGQFFFAGQRVFALYRTIKEAMEVPVQPIRSPDQSTESPVESTRSPPDLPAMSPDQIMESPVHSMRSPRSPVHSMRSYMSLMCLDSVDSTYDDVTMGHEDSCCPGQ